MAEATEASDLRESLRDYKKVSVYWRENLTASRFAAGVFAREFASIRDRRQTWNSSCVGGKFLFIFNTCTSHQYFVCYLLLTCFICVIYSLDIM